jgi:hypothetical protein
MNEPTKAQAMELLDMIEEFPDEEQDLIKLILGTLISAYHNGCIDQLEKVRKLQNVR